VVFTGNGCIGFVCVLEVDFDDNQLLFTPVDTGGDMRWTARLERTKTENTSNISNSARYSISVTSVNNYNLEPVCVGRYFWVTVRIRVRYRVRLSV